MAPKPESIEAVQAWLEENHIQAHKASPFGDWLSLSLPVSRANDLLNAEFKEFVDSSGKTTIRTLAYSIPADLKGHLDFVHPTTTYALIYSVEQGG